MEQIAIVGVPSSTARTVWPIVREWIAEALERGNDLDTPEDVLERIENQEYQLWIVHQGGPCAVFVTRIYSGTRGTALVAVCLGGRGMDTWLFAVEDVITRFAKDKGCSRIYLHGRRGWVRQLAPYGWHEETVNVMKDIS